MTRRVAAVMTVAGLFAAAAGVPRGRSESRPIPSAGVAAVTGAHVFRPNTPHPPPADPFPIRRVLTPAEKLPAPAAGGLRRLPRDEFEALVRRAAAAAAAADASPRLVEARYRAALTDTGLAGTGTWSVVNPGPPAAVTLDPLRVAVWNPRWSDGRDALLFRPAGGAQSPTVLWAGDTGPRVAAFDWSARGVEEPGDLRFDLRLPPAPVAVLELDLPAGRPVIPAQSDLLVTGPLPAADPKRSAWRVVCGGQSRVEFTVPGPGGAAQLAPLARAAQTARFDLTPGQADARFEFDLEAVRGPADVLEFDLDPALKVIDVAASGRESWRVTPGEAGRPARLTVKLREPSPGGRVIVTAVAPLPADGQPWPCPMARPVAAAGEETVELRFGPDLRLDGWDPGDYRPTQTAVSPDRGHSLSLKGSLTAAEVPVRRPPAVRVRPAGAEFATTEEIEWRIEPTRSRLTGRFKVKVVRGPVTQISFRLPPGFVPEPGTAIPDDPAATASPGANRSWTVEPSRPLAGGQTVEVVVALRGPPGPPPRDPASLRESRATLPFPDVAPVAAESRGGVFTVTAAPAYRVWPNPPPAERPAGAFAYRYTGRGPAGSITLAPRRALVPVEGETAVSIDGDRVVAVTRLRPRADAGEVGALTVFAPDDGWEWAAAPEARVNPVGPLLRWLPAFAGCLPVGPDGLLWQVKPDRTAEPSEVKFRATRRLPPGGFAVPVPVVLGAEQPDLPLALDPAVAARFDLAADPADDNALIRTLALRPRGAVAAVPERGWRFADLSLVTNISDGGRVTGVLAGRVTAAAAGTLAVGLPGGAVIETAAVGGRWADVTADGDRVRFPVPTPGPAGEPFELRYSLAPVAGSLTASVASPLPELPGDPGPVARVWVVGTRYRLWPTLASADPVDGEAGRVVDARVPVVTGFVAAAGLAGWAAAWLIGGPPRRPTWAVVVGLAAGLGGGGMLVPDGWQPVVRPPLFASIIAVGVGAVRLARTRTPSAASSIGRASHLVPLTAAGVLVGWLAAGSAARQAGPAVVYVVPTPGGAESVFAPQAVLDRLAAAAAPVLPPVLITSAEYSGRDADEAAVFDATFSVYCTATGDHLLSLPLSGVRLERMLLDGVPAFPDASRPDQFAVVVRGQGRHELTARFSVPVTAAGADRELRFGTPDVPAGRLSFDAPRPSRQFAVPTRRGDLRTTPGAAGTTLRADLGGGKTLTLRWRVGGATGGRPEASVSELCVWELAEDEAGAVAAFVYRVEKGSLARVRVEIPPGWEPGRVAVRPLDATATANGVKNWSLDPAADDWRVFTVGLQAPVEGRVAVVFRLYARRPAAARPPLRAPRAVQVAAADSYVAVRLHGVTAEGWDKTGLIDIPTAALPAEFAGVPELELDKRPPTRSFRREGPGPPTLHPTLHPPADPRPVGHELVWHVGAHAEVEGTVRWARDALSRVEFDVPGAVTVTDVRGPDLAGWSRTGTRVLVWFRSGAKEPAVVWSGTPAAYPVLPGRPPPDHVVVDLPFPPGAGDGVTARVEPVGGWAVGGGKGATFTPTPAGPPPRVTLYPPSPDRPVRVWQSVEPAGGELAWRAEVEVSLRPKRPQVLTLHVGGGQIGPDVKPELPPGVTAEESNAGPPGRAWAVSVPPDGPVPLRVALSARLPAQPVVIPPVVHVLFAGVPSSHTTRWFAAGAGVTPVTRAGLSGADDRETWPDAVRRIRGAGGAVWRAADDEPVRVAWSKPMAPPVKTPTAPAPAAPGAAPPTILYPDSGRWLAAAGWVLGFGFAGWLLACGPRRLRPESLALFGVVAAAGAGSLFLTISLAGAGLRLASTARRLGRAVLR